MVRRGLATRWRAFTARRLKEKTELAYSGDEEVGLEHRARLGLAE
jgi:hypothetical protein